MGRGGAGMSGWGRGGGTAHPTERFQHANMRSCHAPAAGPPMRSRQESRAGSRAPALLTAASTSTPGAAGLGVALLPRVPLALQCKGGG